MSEAARPFDPKKSKPVKVAAWRTSTRAKDAEHRSYLSEPRGPASDAELAAADSDCKRV